MVYLVAISTLIAGIFSGTVLYKRLTPSLPALGWIALGLWCVLIVIVFTGWRLDWWWSLTETMGRAFFWPLVLGLVIGFEGIRIAWMADRATWVKAGHFAILIGVILAVSYSADGFLGTTGFPLSPREAQIVLLYFFAFGGPVIAFWAWITRRGDTSRWLIGTVCGLLVIGAAVALGVSFSLKGWDQAGAMGLSGLFAAGLVALLIGNYFGALWHRWSS